MADSAARVLVCRNCGTEVPLRPQHACYDCFGPLEVGYDPSLFAAPTSRQGRPTFGGTLRCSQSARTPLAG